MSASCVALDLSFDLPKASYAVVHAGRLLPIRFSSLSEARRHLLSLLGFELSPEALRVIEYVLSLRPGTGPLLNEIEAATGVEHLAHNHIPKLVELGLFTYTPGAHRSLRIPFAYKEALTVPQDTRSLPADEKPLRGILE